MLSHSPPFDIWMASLQSKLSKVSKFYPIKLETQFLLNWNLSLSYSLTWRRWWIFNLPALEYLFEHPGWGHLKGFSPVWVSSWACKWPLVMNYWSHCWQIKGRSPVWVRMWVLRLPVSENSFRHFSKGQMRIFFSSFGLLTFSIWAIKHFIMRGLIRHL